MATVEQARRQVTQARQRVAQARARLPSGVSERTLRGGGLQARTQRQERSMELGRVEAQLAAEERKIEKTEQQIKVAEREQTKIERQRQVAVQQASRERNVVDRLVRGRPLNPEDQTIARRLLKESPELREAVSRASTAQALGSAGVISGLSQSAIERLKRRGFISVREVQIKPEVETLKKVESDFIQLIKSSKEASENFFKMPPRVVPKTKEIFDPKLGGFISGSGTGFGATGVIRPPTPKERAEIESAQFAGSIPGIFAAVERVEEKVELALFGRKLNVESRPQTDIFGKPKASLDPFLKPFEAGAEVFLQAGEFVEEKVVPKEVVARIGDSPISRKQAKSILKDILLISTFSPLIKTGVAQRQSTLVEVRDSQGKLIGFIDKADVKKFLRSRGTKFSDRSKGVRDLLDNLKNPNDPVARAKILDAAKEVYGKGFVDDFLAQEGLVSTGVVARPVSRPTITVEVPPIPKIKGITRTTITASTLQPQEVGETSGFKLESMTDTVLDTKTGKKIKQVSVLDIKQTQLSKQAQKQLTKQQQTSKQIQLLALATTQLSAQKQAQKQIQRKEFGRPVRQAPKKPKLRVPPPPPPLPQPSLVQRLAKKLEKEPELFQIFVRKKGKDVKIGKAKTKEEAFTKLRKRLKATVAASGVVKKAGKKVQPSIKFGGDFRLSREDPSRLVQKKARRLGTGGETKEIQFFRKQKKTKTKKLLGF